MPGKGNTPDSTPALQAPWRMDYLERAEAEEKAKPGPDLVSGGGSTGAGAIGGTGSSGSFLVDYWRTPEADVRNHVVFRTPTGMVLLNGFPYTAGHLLVALGEARPSLLDYSASQRADLWRHADLAMALMQETLEPQGVNVGINQGRAAGAGVPQHLHVHLVPRWGGDVNFMSVVGQVRVIPASLERMTEKYRKVWERGGGLEGWRRRLEAEGK